VRAAASARSTIHRRAVWTGSRDRQLDSLTGGRMRVADIAHRTMRRYFGVAIAMNPLPKRRRPYSAAAKITAIGGRHYGRYTNVDSEALACPPSGG
jgi:hypothetical protein